MRAPDTHAVLVRPVATNKWKSLAYAKSAEAAIISAQKPRKSLRHGDLILAIDLAEISAIPERGKCLYFVNENGDTIEAPKPSHDTTWFLEWEGPEAQADGMLGLCDNIDRKLLVTTACAIARIALPYVPTGESRPHIAIEMAEAWIRGEATAWQVIKARDNAWSAANIAGYSAGHAAASVTAVRPSDTAQSATNVAYNAARSMSGDYDSNIRQLSHIVRQYIPLHTVLESRT